MIASYSALKLHLSGRNFYGSYFPKLPAGSFYNFFYAGLQLPVGYFPRSEAFIFPAGGKQYGTPYHISEFPQVAGHV